MIMLLLLILLVILLLIIIVIVIVIVIVIMITREILDPGAWIKYAVSTSDAIVNGWGDSSKAKNIIHTYSDDNNDELYIN